MNEDATDKDCRLTVFQPRSYEKTKMETIDETKIPIHIHHPINDMCFLDFLLGSFIKSYLPKDKKGNICLLPECNRTTYHNGGYCCAEHCKEHERRIKNARKKDNKP
jgi:hypothetical protein